MSRGRDIQPSVLAKASRDFSFTSTAESSYRTNNPSLFCFGDWTLKVKQILGRVHCAFIADSTRENSADEVRFSNYYRIIELSHLFPSKSHSFIDHSESFCLPISIASMYQNLVPTSRSDGIFWKSLRVSFQSKN